ncbi:MAG: Asp-tRNA(Asn)/Glu-tRNA(Gln) amidotransferase subunit GatC [Weeksellaceae bacterium]
MSKSLHTPLTNADVLHIAKLANLTLTEAEVEKFKKQLEDTISYVENLDELDTAKVEPTLHSTNVNNIYFEDGTENKRLFTTDEALKNAPTQPKKKMFTVKRIME